MKNIFIAVLFTSILFSCETDNKKVNPEISRDNSEILFQVRTFNKEDLEIFEDGIIPWISIKNPESEINNLIGKNQIVLNEDSVIIIIDYPVSRPIEIKIGSDDSKGFTRKDLIQKISAEYKRIYKEEEESAKIKTTPLEERQGLINRNKTDGKYGIWGHDIDDLDLSSVIIRMDSNGEIKLELIVES